MLLLLTLGAGLTVGVALLVRFGPPQLKGLGFVIFLGSFVPIYAPLLCQEIGEARAGHGPGRRYLTAVTVTGCRTIDLSKLVRIRRVLIPGKFGAGVDLLVVTDVHRVRIGLVSPTAHVAVWQALRSTGPAALTTKPKISRRARRALGEGEPVSVVWDALDILASIVLMCVWVLVVTAVCSALALA